MCKKTPKEKPIKQCTKTIHDIERRYDYNKYCPFCGVELRSPEAN